MSFFFKSKKPTNGLPSASRKLTSADGSTVSSYSVRGDGPVSGSPASVTTNNSMMRRTQLTTPEPHNLQTEQQPAQALQPIRSNGPPQRPPADMSLYPWSIQRLDFVSGKANPFPRYGAAINAVASREGDIYLMGGLINGVTVQGDLWIVESGSSSLSCYPVQTTAEGPGARVGHASLLVGNAFIVFGGDTKLTESDPLDDTLYLLNTSTKHWSRALPPGHRPAGRYGHTLNILGSKIFVFGGQVEGFFFNDLVAFDLNALQQANSRWETLIGNTIDGGPSFGQVPPARTNHTIITYQDKLFLFGGTDGVRWYNDVWVYDSRANVWLPQECIGFIPTPREGHAAALVGDVMYVFGGRTEEGKDLGDLAAFRIPTKRWYTFQNMGPSPSPRSGHGMTAFGERIVVLAGEPSSAPRDPSELSLAYMLDTTKIRYPTDTPAQRSIGGGSRRPSVNERSQTPQSERSVSRNGEYGVNGIQRLKQGSQESLHSALDSPRRNMDGSSVNGYIQNGVSPNVPRSGAPSPVPSTPQQTPQSRTYGTRPTLEGPASPTRIVTSRQDRYPSSVNDNGSPAPISREAASPPANISSGQYSRPRTPQGASGATSMRVSEESITAPRIPLNIPNRTVSQRNQRQRPSVDSMDRSIPDLSDVMQRPSVSDATSNMVRPQQSSDGGVAASPALTQKNAELLKELQLVRSKNAWYASELGLARKAGYVTSATESQMLNDKSVDGFTDDEKPLLEALLRMRAELAKVQESLVTQSVSVAEKIAQIQKERDAAITEATYNRTRIAAFGSQEGMQTDGSRDIKLPNGERFEDVNRRLASALAAHKDSASRMKALTAELESERKARQLAEESAEVAHGRASQLDSHRQQNSTELERIRSELYDAQKTVREGSANAAEAQASTRMLQIDKNELLGKLASAQETARGHDSVLGALRDAVLSSTEKASLLERKMEQERKHRHSLEEKMARLRGEHEARVAELENVRAQLNDAEELSETHAAEARKHREVVLAGFGQRNEREIDDFAANDERVSILQQRLEAANAMVRRNQDAADRAAERLRRAEERIAGLELYQEQTSREGLNFRKQLQVASREALTLKSENATLQQQLATEKMDATALQVQHGALKDLLSERGVDTSLPSKGNRLSSNNGMAGAERLQELEQQLDASVKAHEEMRSTFEQREQEANKGWEDKLAALDNDYQSAVKYLKGTEKMLSKMKQELHRYKSQNKDLEDELGLERSKGSPTVRDAPADWENERKALRTEIETLQSRVQRSAAQLEQQMHQLREVNTEREKARNIEQELDRQRQELENVKKTNGTLETRAVEAERKVQMLLDTVGSTVSNYRRSSQMNMPDGYIQHGRDVSVNSLGGGSDYNTGSEERRENTGLASSGLTAAVPLDSRNSMALDSLANELETLRTQWQTTNKAYRLSDTSELGDALEAHSAGTREGGDRFDGEGSVRPMDGLMVNWRERLQIGDEASRRSGASEASQVGDS